MEDKYCKKRGNKLYDLRVRAYSVIHRIFMSTFCGIGVKAGDVAINRQSSVLKELAFQVAA